MLWRPKRWPKAKLVKRASFETPRLIALLGTVRCPSRGGPRARAQELCAPQEQSKTPIPALQAARRPRGLSVTQRGQPKVTAVLQKPKSAADWRDARRLVEEYASSLNLDLSFQNFARELEHLENEYSPPAGAFLLVREEGAFVGCVGLRKLTDTAGEIKRLYVAPAARGYGLGETLARGIVEEGRQLKYARLVLDTLPSMLAARSLYQALGFKPVEPYRYNPVPGTAFLELRLQDQGAV